MPMSGLEGIPTVLKVSSPVEVEKNENNHSFSNDMNHEVKNQMVEPPEPTKLIDIEHDSEEKVKNIETDGSSLSDPLMVDEITLDQMDVLKTYYPTEEEFKDPYQYIHSLQEKEFQVGAVKIVPPSTFKITDSQDLRLNSFPVVRQSKPLDNEEKIDFYKSLLKFHYANNTPIVRLPSIDKRVLDLFKLRQSVSSKGGFDCVCKKKLWAQVGRELGYTGRIMTSLSSSLKLAYTKILLEYDALDHPDLKNEPKKETSESVNNHSELSQTPNDNNKRPILQNLANDPSFKKIKTSSKVTTPIITNSKHTFIRPKDIVKAKGLISNFDSYTDERQGITTSDSQTFPFYDFNFWHDGLEVQDFPYPSTEVSRHYSFEEFYNTHLKDLKPTTFEEDSSLVDKFWKKVKTGEELDFETSEDLPSSIYGSTFPTLSQSLPKEQVLHTWNLNNIPLNQNNILRFLKSDSDSITKPNICLNTLFSVSSWRIEDHFLYYADYLSQGSNKVWYFIEPKDRERFENLVSQKLKEKTSESINSKVFEEFSKDPIISDIFEGFKEGDTSNNRTSTTNIRFDKLYDHKSSKLSANINTNMLLEPSVLAVNGIKIHYSIQKEGEFIIKFPQSYSSVISLGGSISEGVNFAPIDWLNHAVEAEKWMAQHAILPRFSYFQLLVNIVEDSKDPVLLKRVHQDFSKLVENELQKRQNLRSNISHLRTINDKFDYISDDTLGNEFPTKLTVNDGDDSFIIDCQDFLKKLELKLYDPDYFKGFSNFTMHVYLTDENLKSLSKTLNTFSQSPEDWLKKYRDIFQLDLDTTSQSYSKPTLKNLKSLLGEAERIQIDVKEAKWVSDYINANMNWVEKAQELLLFTQGSRTRNKKQNDEATSNKYSTTDEGLRLLNTLYKIIPTLHFTIPEFDQIYELFDKIQEYESSVFVFMQENHTLEEINDMLDLGKSCGIYLKSVEILGKISSRLTFIKKYEDLSKEIRPDGSRLEAYAKLLEEGYTVCVDEDLPIIQDLEKQVEIGKYFNARIEHELADISTLDITKIEEMQRIIEEYPVGSDFSARLEELKREHMNTNASKGAIIKIIHENKERFKPFSIQRSLKAAGHPYDQNLYESELKFLKGDSFDVRPNYSQVKDLSDKSKELEPNRSTIEFLDYRLRELEDWLRSCKRLFGKANAPFSVLKGHLSSILEKVQYSLNVEDTCEASYREHLIYCVCRCPESGIMICCEKCNEWYHCKCLKLGRGRAKDVDKYVCCICDYRVDFPREFSSPKLEDIGKLIDKSMYLDVYPDELDAVRSIYDIGVEFRALLEEKFGFQKGKPSFENVSLDELKFILRKLQGSYVLLSNEYNELRQEVWRRDPCCEEAPPLVENREKTKKKRKVAPTKPKEDKFELPNMGQFRVIPTEEVKQVNEIKSNSTESII